MNEIAWETVRDSAIEQFGGQTPLAEAEERIITHFEHQPTIVIQAITEIAKATNVTWKWSALAGRLDKATTAPPRNPIVQTGTNRTQAVAKADAFMRNAGLHFDHQPELEDELFGDRGLLQPWANSTKLQERMTQAWEHIRPIGQQLEAQELERAEHWRTHRPDKPKPKPQPVTTPPPDEPEPADYDYGNPQEPEPT